MGDDRQSEQTHQAPTPPDSGNTEPPDCGNQADAQSNEAAVTSQLPKRRHFPPRLRKRRTTDNAEQASPQEATKKSQINLVGILITALVGFFFGIGSNQVTDYVKRADDCADALAQYVTGVNGNFNILSIKMHDHALAPDQIAAAGQQYVDRIVVPRLKISEKCPVRGSSEYLISDDVNRFKASSGKLEDCFNANECSDSDVGSDEFSAMGSALKLEREALVVSQWGLVRRAKYVIMHLY